MATSQSTPVQLALFLLDKVCSSCGQTKPLDAFRPSPTAFDGRRNPCLECGRAASRAWHRANEEHAWALCKRYYDAHQSERQAYSRAYYAAHADHRRAYSRAYHAAHRAAVAASRRQYRARNRLALLEGNLKRYARKMGADGTFSRADIRGLARMQEGLCYYCAEPYGRYHIEHKQPLTRGGTNWPDNLALTCAACNLSKGAKTEAEYRAWRTRHRTAL